MTRDPKERFSDRVEDYVRYRPGYPEAIVGLLESECGLERGSPVADVGSGTGLLARLLLDHGYAVFGIEPNAAMREAGERCLTGHQAFTSIDGSAEATGLAEESVALVVAGQAFHWFDRTASRAELRRILRPPGWTALIWNERRKDGNAFLTGYERLLLRWGTDYRDVDHSRIGPAELAPFFSPDPVREAVFENRQQLDLDGLRGRLLSSSYVPAPGRPGHERLLAEMKELFDQHHESGRVTLEYATRVFYGRLRPPPP